jgi:hypothetical protein
MRWLLFPFLNGALSLDIEKNPLGTTPCVPDPESLVKREINHLK